MYLSSVWHIATIWHITAKFETSFRFKILIMDYQILAQVNYIIIHLIYGILLHTNCINFICLHLCGLVIISMILSHLILQYSIIISGCKATSWKPHCKIIRQYCWKSLATISSKARLIRIECRKSGENTYSSYLLEK